MFITLVLTISGILVLLFFGPAKLSEKRLSVFIFQTVEKTPCSLSHRLFLIESVFPRSYCAFCLETAAGKQNALIIQCSFLIHMWPIFRFLQVKRMWKMLMSFYESMSGHKLYWHEWEVAVSTTPHLLGMGNFYTHPVGKISLRYG